MSIFSRHFVWYCTPDSIEGGKVSVLACGEVIFAVAAYFWLTWYFDTYAFLVTSLVAAPFVLLRSDESVALGVKWFMNYWDAEDISTKSFLKILVLAAVLSAAAIGFFLSFYGQNLTKVELFFTIGMLSIIWMALTFSLHFAFGGEIPRAYHKYAVVPFFFATMGFPSICVGILIRAISTRGLASARHIVSGASALPTNWMRTLFLTDFLSPPELLPGISERATEISADTILSELRTNPTLGAWVMNPVSLSIFFLPALIYRYSIKSTCWLYLPLIYLVHRPAWTADPAERWARFRARPGILLEWVWGILAFVTILVTVLGWFNPAKVADVIVASKSGAFPISVFLLPFVVELDGTRVWHWLSLASAGMTLVTILWLQAIFAYERAGSKMDHRDWQVWTVFYLERVRTVVVVTLLVVALYSTLAYLHAQCGLPNWMNSVLELHYAPACPVH